MPNFRYRGVTAAGEEVSGTLEAARKSAAVKLLAARGIEAYSIGSAAGHEASLKTSAPKPVHYFQMLDQFSVLVSADIPVLEAVESLRNTVEHQKTSQQLDELAILLRRGDRLSDAMKVAFPQLPGLVPNLVGLGERTGNLAEVLQIVSRQLGMQEKIKSDLRSAFTYPIFLISIGVIVVVFLFIFVVPRFAGMIGDRRDEIGGVSQLVFSTSEFLVLQWPLVVASLVGLGLLIAVSWRSDGIRQYLIQAMFSLPIIGSLLSYFEMANWTRTVGIAFKARANLLDAVTLARNSISSKGNRAAFDSVARDLRSGQSLDEALGKVAGIEPVIVNLVRTGVKAGRLADMLMVATSILDERIAATSARISKLAEPVAVLIISSLIGIVVVSIVSAMTSLYEVAI